jgi:hypothetical protein
MQRGAESRPVTDTPLLDCDIRVREAIPQRAIAQMPPLRGVDLPPRCSECALFYSAFFIPISSSQPYLSTVLVINLLPGVQIGCAFIASFSDS